MKWMKFCAKRLLIKQLSLSLNKGQGLNSGEGGEVTEGEVSMERSKGVREEGGKDHYQMMDFATVQCINP